MRQADASELVDQSIDIVPAHQFAPLLHQPQWQHLGLCSDMIGICRRFGKQDFVYLPEEDAYQCPAGE
jgi:hypothetical protein